MDDASGVLRRLRREGRSGTKGVEGRARMVVLEQRRAMVAKALDECMMLGSDFLRFGFGVGVFDGPVAKGDGFD